MDGVREGWKSETKVGFVLRSHFIKTISKAYQNPPGFVTKQNSMNKKIKFSYISSSPADFTKRLTDTEPITYSVI